MLRKLTTLLMLTMTLYVALFGTASVLAADYSYQAIAKRNSGVALSAQQVAAIEMQGECLFGLKQLNFKKKDVFDPVAEWTSYRSKSLLEQYSPCEVLIMIGVARKSLLQEEAQ